MPPNGPCAVHLVGFRLFERGLLNEDEAGILRCPQVDAGLMPVRTSLPSPATLSRRADAGSGMIISARWLSWFMLSWRSATPLRGHTDCWRACGLIAIAVMTTRRCSSRHRSWPSRMHFAHPTGAMFLLAARDRPRVFMIILLSVGARLTLAVPLAVLVLGHLRGRPVAALVGTGVGLALGFAPLAGLSGDELYAQLIGPHVDTQPTLSERGAWLMWQLGLLAFWLLALKPSDRHRYLDCRWRLASVSWSMHGPVSPCRAHDGPALFAVALASRWRDPWTPRQLVIAGAALSASVVVGARFVHLDTQSRTMQQVTDLAGAAAVGRTASADPAPRDRRGG